MYLHICIIYLYLCVCVQSGMNGSLRIWSTRQWKMTRCIAERCQMYSRSQT